MNNINYYIYIYIYIYISYKYKYFYKLAHDLTKNPMNHIWVMTNRLVTTVYSGPIG